MTQTCLQGRSVDPPRFRGIISDDGAQLKCRQEKHSNSIIARPSLRGIVFIAQIDEQPP